MLTIDNMRCAFHNKRGERCKRNTVGDSLFCKAHQPDSDDETTVSGSETFNIKYSRIGMRYMIIKNKNKRNPEKIIQTFRRSSDAKNLEQLTIHRLTRTIGSGHENLKRSRGLDFHTGRDHRVIRTAKFRKPRGPKY